MLTVCTPKKTPQRIHLAGKTQGTYYSIIYYDEQKRSFDTEIQDLLKSFDMSVSLWEPNSILSRVNRNDTTVILDSIFIKNFNVSKEMSEQTDGYFDLTVAPLTQAWGFSAKKGNDSLTTLIIDSLKQLVDWRNVSIVDEKVVKKNPYISLDFNAIAQGYSADLVGEFLNSKGINNYLVDIGGEIVARGNKPDGSQWIVGIEKPAETKDSERKVQIRIALKDKALATSGNYRKYVIRQGKRYSHSINPKTGYPVDHNLLSVTVIAENAIKADALGTAFMIMGMEKAKEYAQRFQGIEICLIFENENGNLETFASAGFSTLILD
jgi:thiamine biosynthesis lipoprotein